MLAALPGQDAKANLAFHQIMDGIDEVTEVAAETIVEMEAATIHGLRAKALGMLWEVRPSGASHQGAFEFPDDGGASRSLFDAVESLTGLIPLVREIEARLAADKEDEA